MVKAKKTEGKQFRGQYDDEEVLYVFKKHPVVMRKGLILFMFAVLLGTLPSFIWVTEAVLFSGIAIGFVVGLLVALPSWVYWYFSVNIMTDQRFIQSTQKGFFHKTVSDTGIKHIQSINFQVAGIQETILGFGSILIQTYLGDILIKDVHHPEQVTNELFDILREHGSVEYDEMTDDEAATKTSRRT